MENGQKFALFLALILLVLLENKNCMACFGPYPYRSNPPRTDYGFWSDIYSCPGDGRFVTGMQLKSEAIDESSEDNTALNAIAFTCSSPLCEEDGPSYVMWGEAAPWGTWGSKFTCPNYGYAVGFQMRSEADQGEGDDTAANNLRMVCNDGNGKLTVFEGDGATLGDWTEPQLCPIGMAITAMIVQVETGQDEDDHTALNKLTVWCTPAPFPC